MAELSLDQLRADFESRYKQAPTLLVRCPGRVNLIGEHVDYSGYGVLPMAVRAATTLLVAPNSSGLLRLQNVDPQYKDFSLDVNTAWKGCDRPGWGDYFLCGWRAAVEDILKTDASGGDNPTRRGFDVLLSGTIPASSGLSSSSALVCAAALATLAIQTGSVKWDTIDKVSFAALMAKAEQYIGVQGGGMDQAIEVLAQKGVALHIEFSPLRHNPVHLPDDAEFVVLHSGAVLNKAATSDYNLRVVDCRLAAKLLGKLLGIKDYKTACVRLVDTQKLSGLSIGETAKKADELLPKGAVQRAELCKLLDVDDATLVGWLSENTKNTQEFKLHDRAVHVYGEAQRVFDFKAACEKGSLDEMGQLLKDSHTSLRDLYECSCPELDKVVADCERGGALGARLTGAGWGGCAVALLRKGQQLNGVTPLFSSSPETGIHAEWLT